VARFRDLSVRTKLSLLIGVFIVGFVVVVKMLLDQATLERTSFESSGLMKDLVADVLPPPKYIIEPYLTLLQLSYETDPGRRDALLRSWASLKQSFEERQAFWHDKLPDNRLKQALERDSTDPARAFFTLADREFLPAVQAGDGATVRALLTGKLDELYRDHRTAINVVVAEADQQSASHLREAAATVAASRIRLVVLGLAILGACIVFGWSVARSITRRVRSTVAALDAVAAGDLTGRMDDDAADDLGKMARALNAAIGGMSRTLGQVKDLSRTLTSAAQELTSSAGEIANGAGQQSAASEQTTAAMTQIGASVQSNTNNAAQSDRLAAQAANEAKSSSRAVSDTVAAMQHIAEKIGLVEEIARKTDLLALNAAVEAARAGDHGRGFAVVASEVRKLAERSSIAAREIRELSRSGVTLAENAGTSLDQLVPGISRTAELVQDVSVACREQSSGIEETHKALQDLDRVTQQNAAAAEQLAATAGALASHATALETAIEFFQVERAALRPQDPPARSRSRPAGVPAVRARGRATAGPPNGAARPALPAARTTNRATWS